LHFWGYRNRTHSEWMMERTSGSQDWNVWKVEANKEPVRLRNPWLHWSQQLNAEEMESWKLIFALCGGKPAELWANGCG